MIKTLKKLNAISNYWEIIKFIADKEFTAVTDIYIQLRLDQSKVSQILYKLRRYEIVSFYKNGKLRIYYIHEDFFTFVEKFNHAIHRIEFSRSDIRDNIEKS